MFLPKNIHYRYVHIKFFIAEKRCVFDRIEKIPDAQNVNTGEIQKEAPSLDGYLKKVREILKENLGTAFKPEVFRGSLISIRRRIGEKLGKLKQEGKNEAEIARKEIIFETLFYNWEKEGFFRRSLIYYRIFGSRMEKLNGELN